MEFYLHLDLEKKNLQICSTMFEVPLCDLFSHSLPFSSFNWHQKKKKGERREKEWTFWYSIETLGSAQFLKENQIITPRPSLRGLTLREKRHS